MPKYCLMHHKVYEKCWYAGDNGFCKFSGDCKVVYKPQTAPGNLSNEASLLNCPFCGGDNITIDTAICDNPESGYGVTCHTNGCIGNIFRHNSYYHDKESVIRAWNKRAI